MKPECGPQFAGPQHHQSSWGEGEMCQFKPHWHKALPAPSRLSEATTKIPSSGQRMSPQLKSPHSNVPTSPVLAAELLVTAANSPRARGLLPLLGPAEAIKEPLELPSQHLQGDAKPPSCLTSSRQAKCSSCQQTMCSTPFPALQLFAGPSLSFPHPSLLDAQKKG